PKPRDSRKVPGGMLLQCRPTREKLSSAAGGEHPTSFRSPSTPHPEAPMRARFLLLLLVPMSVVSMSAARAAVPDAALSSVDPCLIVCPGGDFTFHVTVRDVAGVPIANSYVTIDLCHCARVHVCPGTPCPVAMHTEAAGTANFQIKAGGVCPDSPVSVRADGVPLRMRGVASPDQNGDLIVDAADIAVAVGKLGTSDNTADFDCD